MNDDQLIAAIRGLDRPVEPGLEFAARLFVDLERRAGARSAPRLHLVLVAALVTVAAMAAALVVGLGAIRSDRALSDTTTPVPAPSARPYEVEIPAGVTPKSSPEDVERELGRSGALQAPFAATGIRSMRWHTRGTVPVHSGSVESDVPVWVVLVVGTDGRRLSVLIEDGTLDIGVSAQDVEPVSSPAQSVEPVIPLSTRDPGVPLQLIGADGRTITPRVVAAPDATALPIFAEGTSAGDVLWAVARNELYRIDATTREIATVELPDGDRTSVVGGLDVLWVKGSGEQLLALDPKTGELIRSLSAPGGVLGEDDDGLWVSDRGGIALWDAEAGRRIRGIATIETEGSFPYTRISEMPSYGSLWDIDRGTGNVHRIDPVSGETVATIQIGADESCGSMDPEPLRGVNGLPDVLSACNGTVLIDPATNDVVRRYSEPRHGFVMSGGWWSFEFQRNGPGWRSPGELVRFDPAGGPPLERFQLNHERTAGFPIGIAGDALWFMIGERGGENKSFSRNPALVWIPLSELSD